MSKLTFHFAKRSIKIVMLSLIFSITTIMSVWAGVCGCTRNIDGATYDVSWWCGSSGYALVEGSINGKSLGYYYITISEAEEFCG